MAASASTSFFLIKKAGVVDELFFYCRGDDNNFLFRSAARLDQLADFYFTREAVFFANSIPFKQIINTANVTDQRASVCFHVVEHDSGGRFWSLRGSSIRCSR